MKTNEKSIAGSGSGLGLCPGCCRPLTALRTTSGEPFYVCIDCGGRGFKLATLSEVVTPLTFKRMISHYGASRTTSTRECPECSAKMRQLNLEILGQQHALEICGHSELAWFDFGEFENLPLLPIADLEIKYPPTVIDALADIESRGGHVVANRSSFRLDANDFGFGWDRDAKAPTGFLKYILAFMLMPMEREQRLARKPWATWALIGACFVFSIYGFDSNRFALDWALDSGNPWHLAGANFFTYFFVHGGWSHLLGNMYFLWLYGDNVEDELGAGRFLFVVALGTAGGGLLQLLLDHNGYLVGASAGISTLGMLYSLRFPRAKLGFYLLFGWLRVPAYALTAIWIYMQLGVAIDQLNGLTNVSGLGHVGGALVGGLAYWLLYKRDSDRSPLAQR